MKPEYVIMVGNLFLKSAYTYEDSFSFISSQEQAKRYTD